MSTTVAKATGGSYHRGSCSPGSQSGPSPGRTCVWPHTDGDGSVWKVAEAAERARAGTANVAGVRAGGPQPHPASFPREQL